MPRTPSDAPTTHPWMTFSFQEHLQPATWVLLGEALSKCEHLSGSALAPPVARELEAIYVARGARATTAIEGNTLSEAQVLELVEGKDLDLPPSLAYQQQEVDNIIVGIAQIDEAVKRGVRLPLTVQRILDIHAQVLHGLDNPPDDCPGEMRQHNVRVGGVYLPPDWNLLPGLLQNLVDWLHEMEPSTDAAPADRFYATLLRAILGHLYLAWIHPFGNGNGRTARLLEVQILAQSGMVPLIAANLFSDHYNKTRDRYYQRLADASRRGDVAGFVHYAIEGFVGELRMQIREVSAHNRRIAWESYIHEAFSRVRASSAKSRQRELALALPDHQWLTKKEATELSPRLIREYALCGDRTPARDLNDLVKLGLVERAGSRYRAKTHLIEAFVSPTFAV